MNFRLFSTHSISIILFLFCTHIHSLEENFLLINGNTNAIVIESGLNIDTQMSPCSTFKITLALMGFDAEILHDKDLPVWEYQEGYDDFLESWKAPQTPQSWMQHSCLWYSKLIALQLGAEQMQKYLHSMEYGNTDISSGLPQPEFKNVAWINSSLKISVREQVEFIRKLVLHLHPITPNAIQMTKAILFKEELSNGWTLFGKTGWSGSDITKDGITWEHRWFVGWIEKKDQFYPFAYLCRDNKIALNETIPRVKQLLTEATVSP